jgi:hypothetical protein
MHPLPEPKGPQQLLLGVLKGWGNGVNCGYGQEPPRLQGTALGPQGQFLIAHCRSQISDWRLGMREIHRLLNLKEGRMKTEFQTYSYRNASTGSSFEALSAGTKPLITPTTSKTIEEMNTVIKEILR